MIGALKAAHAGAETVGPRVRVSGYNPQCLERGQQSVSSALADADLPRQLDEATTRPFHEVEQDQKGPLDRTHAGLTGPKFGHVPSVSFRFVEHHDAVVAHDSAGRPEPGCRPASGVPTKTLSEVAPELETDLPADGE